MDSENLLNKYLVKATTQRPDEEPEEKEMPEQESGEENSYEDPADSKPQEDTEEEQVEQKTGSGIQGKSQKQKRARKKNTADQIKKQLEKAAEQDSDDGIVRIGMAIPTELHTRMIIYSVTHGGKRETPLISIVKDAVNEYLKKRGY